MKLSLKKAFISAVVVLAGVSLFMPVASSFAAPSRLVAVEDSTTAPASPDSTSTASSASSSSSSSSSSSTSTTDVTVARCEGGVLGWILCPVIKLSQDFVGQMEKWIVNQLDMGPLQTTGRYENLHKAWAGFRDLANVFFIGIFMVIIFAQVLGISIDSYSIKMLLPRIIVAAIAIQFSFFIMQIGVDISNIIGNGIAGVFASVIQAGGEGGAGVSTTQAIASLTIVGAGGALAAGTAIATGLIVPFLLLILAAAISILGVVITVWLRVLVLQFLVLLAPLAIVAWVMPNTEKWFQFWKTNVIKLLLMYPIIMFMISAGALATHITAISAEDGNFAKLLGACIPIIIFLMIPTAIKASGSLMNLTGNLVMGRMNNYSKAVRNSGLMKDAKEDFKNKAYLQYADNDPSAVTGFGKKGKAMTRRGMARMISGNAFSFQHIGDSGTRKMAKGVEHARHLIEDDWKTFFRDNAFGNPELLKIAQAGLVDHKNGEIVEVPNSYGSKYKFKMNHHLAEAAVGQMIQQSGYVELSELVDGKKNAEGTARDNSRGLFDHTTNQWKSKEIQATMLRAMGSNAGATLQKITHAVHLQGDRAYGELQASALANLGAGSGITAAQQAVKWNAANALNSMIQVVNSNGLANSIQLDVARSMKRELLAAEEAGKFNDVTITTREGTMDVRKFLDTYITNGGQVTAIQGEVRSAGLNDLIAAQKAIQDEMAEAIKQAREDQINNPGGDHH